MTAWRAAGPAALAGSLAAALVVLLLLELRPGGAAPPRAPRPPGTAVASVLAGTVQPDDAALLARPLFSPSRRPVAAAATPVLAAQAEAPPRLVGVMLSGASRSAIFAVAGERTAVAAPGQRVGGFVVRSIEPDAVTMQSAQGEQVLRLGFLKPGGGAPAAPAAPAAPGLFPGLPAVRFGPGGLPVGIPQAPS